MVCFLMVVGLVVGVILQRLKQKSESFLNWLSKHHSALSRNVVFTTTCFISNLPPYYPIGSIFPIFTAHVNDPTNVIDNLLKRFSVNIQKSHWVLGWKISFPLRLLPTKIKCLSWESGRTDQPTYRQKDKRTADTLFDSIVVAHPLFR